MEVGPFAGQAVDVWCLHVVMAVTAKIAPTPVVGKDEEDVWSFSRFRNEHRPTDEGDNHKRVERPSHLKKSK